LHASLNKRLKEGGFLLLLAVSAFFLMALLSYSPEDPSWGYVGPRDHALNAGGPTGAWFASVLFSLVGIIAYLFPVMIGWAGWMMFRERNEEASQLHLSIARWLGFFLILIGATALSTLHVKVGTTLPPVDACRFPDRFHLVYRYLLAGRDGCGGRRGAGCLAAGAGVAAWPGRTAPGAADEGGTAGGAEEGEATHAQPQAAGH
jgi:hypothetical protein